MNPDPPQDEGLMAQLAEGRKEALEILIARHREHVATFLRRLVGAAGPIDDLVQETFVRVFRGCVRYRPTARFTTWLLALARNVGIDHLRSQRRKGSPQVATPFASSSGLSGIPASVATPSAQVSAEEFAGLVHEALLRLPVEQREAILLVEFEGLSLREAGEAIGAKLKTVASRLSRGKERLRELLRSLLPPEPRDPVSRS